VTNYESYLNGSTNRALSAEACAALKVKFKQELILAPIAQDLHTIRTEAYAFARNTSVSAKDAVEV